VLEGPPIKLINGLARTKGKPTSLPAAAAIIAVSSSRVRTAHANSSVRSADSFSRKGTFAIVLSQ
jgi:hypothetical protein